MRQKTWSCLSTLLFVWAVGGCSDDVGADTGPGANQDAAGDVVKSDAVSQADSSTTDVLKPDGAGGTSEAGKDAGQDSAEEGGNGGDGGVEDVVTPDGDAGVVSGQFAQPPVSWPVPPQNTSVLPYGFYSDLWRLGAQYWRTVDMDGDERPDLVWSAEPIDTGDDYIGKAWGLTTGTPTWKVFHNNGAGFDQTSLSWSVPVPDSQVLDRGFYGTDVIDNVEGPPRPTRGEYWTTIDVTGDKRPDLVWTSEPVADGSKYIAKAWGTGTAANYWRVFKNTGSGFESSANEWSIPLPETDVLDQGFYATEWAGGVQQWATVDMDADGYLDFVWTSEPKFDNMTYTRNVWGVGTSSPYWKFYRNNHSGFETSPAQWQVPAEVAGTGFYAMNAVDAGYWFTLDIDGDNRPDLVWTAASAGVETAPVVWGGADGNPYWKVYKNTGSGFASSHSTWAVPAPDSDILSSGFFAGFVAIDAGYWSVTDMDGDSLPDLVWTGEPLSDGSSFDSTVWGQGTTAPYWKVYRNTGTGFETTSRTWRVPPTDSKILDHGFYWTDFALGAQYWSTRDMNGDHRPDLVWTGEPKTGYAQVWGNSTPDPFWKVFLNTP